METTYEGTGCMNQYDEIREAFEKVSAPNFGTDRFTFQRNSVGEYFHPVLEDHWQTFQEGWEEAIKYALLHF